MSILDRFGSVSETALKLSPALRALLATGEIAAASGSALGVTAMDIARRKAGEMKLPFTPSMGLHATSPYETPLAWSTAALIKKGARVGRKVMDRFQLPAEQEYKPEIFPPKVEEYKLGGIPARKEVYKQGGFIPPMIERAGVGTIPPFTGVKREKVFGREEGKRVGIEEEIKPLPWEYPSIMKAEEAKPLPTGAPEVRTKKLSKSIPLIELIKTNPNIQNTIKIKDGLVTIYRGTEEKVLKSGDYVTFDKNRAKYYTGSRKIIEQQVPIQDLRIPKTLESTVRQEAFYIPTKPTEAPKIKGVVSVEGEAPWTKEQVRALKHQKDIEKGEAGYISTDYFENIRKSFVRGGGVKQDIWELNKWRQGNVKADIFNASDKLKQLQNMLKDEPDSTKEAVTNYLRGETTIAHEFMKPLLDKAREDIDAISQRFIASGIPKETTKLVIQQNLGKYMVTAYRVFEEKGYEPSIEVKQKAIAKLRQIHPKALGKLSDEEMLKVVDSIIGKKEYSLYRAGKKAVIIPQAHLKHRKDIPKEIRDLYGEIKDPVWLYAKTMSELTRLSSNAEFFSELSKIPDVASKYQTQVNSMPLPDTPSYGELAGKFVAPELAEFIQQQTNPTGFTMFDKFVVAPFKWTKTIGNIPTHPRNFMGNLVFSVMEGTTPLDPRDIEFFRDATGILREKIAADTMNQPMKQPAKGIWENLLRRDAIETEFYGGEVSKVLSDTLNDLEKSGYDSLLHGLWNMAKKPADFLGELYNAEDQIFKIASYLKSIKKRGLTPEQASMRIDSHYPNYRDVPKITKTLRKVPVLGRFVSFKSESLRIFSNYLSEGMKDFKDKKDPSKLVKLIFILSLNRIIRETMAKLHNIDLNKMKKLEHFYPVYRKYAEPIYYRDNEGNIKSWDLTYIMPQGEHQQWMKALAAGDTGWMANSMFGSPEFDIVGMLKYGETPYTKESIRTELGGIDIGKFGKEVAKEIAIPSYHGIRGLREAGVFGKEAKAIDRWGRSRDAVEEIRAFLTGIRTGKLHPDIIINNAQRRLMSSVTRLNREFSAWELRHPNASEKTLNARQVRYEKQIDNVMKELDRLFEVEQ